MLDMNTLRHKLNEEGRLNFSNKIHCHDCPWWGGVYETDDDESYVEECHMGDVVRDSDLEEADRLGVVIDCDILTTEAAEKGYLE